jgi:hypothetical protein
MQHGNDGDAVIGWAENPNMPDPGSIDNLENGGMIVAAPFGNPLDLVKLRDIKTFGHGIGSRQTYRISVNQQLSSQTEAITMPEVVF